MDIRYPIGRYQPRPLLTPEERRIAREHIADLPKNLREAVAGLSSEPLNTPYRPGGWTVRQVVHHLADSHMNAFVRFKLALTEEEPEITVFDQARWATLDDAEHMPVEPSLNLVEALHRRWVVLIEAMQPEDFARRLRHPERGMPTLDEMLALYDWHGRHHVAHITSLRQRNGWN